jgi:GntR family transcriptional regulator
MPLYLQLERQIGDLVARGVVPVGAVLPAERSLAERLGVSRVTVQRAYDALRQKGVLSAEGRRGFHVRGTGPQLHPGMDRLKGFTEEMRLLGKRPSTKIVERAVARDRLIASLFGLPSTAPFLKLVRVRFGDDVPLTREVAWYSLQAAPALENSDLLGSVYDFLATECNVPLLHCEQTVEATLPTDEECKTFGLTQPVPSLLIKRKSYTHGDVMVEYVEGLFRGDAYSYKIRLGS